MGHGHSRPAGWSCRCGPRVRVLVCVRVCLCVCALVSLYTPVPWKHSLLWDSVVFQARTLKFWSLKPLEQESPQWAMTSSAGFIVNVTWRGVPLCLNGFICSMAMQMSLHRVL